jgi:hypothetical protein
MHIVIEITGNFQYEVSFSRNYAKSLLNPPL